MGVINIEVSGAAMTRCGQVCSNVVVSWGGVDIFVCMYIMRIYVVVIITVILIPVAPVRISDLGINILCRFDRYTWIIQSVNISGTLSTRAAEHNGCSLGACKVIDGCSLELCLATHLVAPSGIYHRNKVTYMTLSWWLHYCTLHRILIILFLISRGSHG